MCVRDLRLNSDSGMCLSPMLYLQEGRHAGRSADIKETKIAEVLIHTHLKLRI